VQPIGLGSPNNYLGDDPSLINFLPIAGYLLKELFRSSKAWLHRRHPLIGNTSNLSWTLAVIPSRNHVQHHF